MLSFKNVFIVLAVFSFFAACKNVEFQKTKAGVPFKIFSSGKGEKIVPGNIVKYHITLKVKDSILSTTHGNFPKYEEVGPATGSYEMPLMEILSKAKKGDSIYVVQAIDSFIAKNPMIEQQTPFRKGDQLITTIRIIDVFKNSAEGRPDFDRENKAYTKRMTEEHLKKLQSDPQIKEQMNKDTKIIQDYLTANNIQAQKTPMGVFVQLITPGTGMTADEGKFISVFYTGTTLQGKQFDSNVGKQPYTVQIGSGGSIIGFEDGLKGLQKGAKAKILIPSSLAYGSQARSDVIKENENLIFDVDVVDVSNDAPAPPPAAQTPHTKDDGHGH